MAEPISQGDQDHPPALSRTDSWKFPPDTTLYIKAAASCRRSGSTAPQFGLLKQPTPQRLKGHYRRTQSLACADATDRICNPEQERRRFTPWERIGGIGQPRSASIQVGELGEKVTGTKYMGLGENRFPTLYSLHAVRGDSGAEIQRGIAQFSPASRRKWLPIDKPSIANFQRAARPQQANMPEPAAEVPLWGREPSCMRCPVGAKGGLGQGIDHQPEPQCCRPCPAALLPRLGSTGPGPARGVAEGLSQKEKDKSRWMKINIKPCGPGPRAGLKQSCRSRAPQPPVFCSRLPLLPFGPLAFRYALCCLFDARLWQS
jgi:hypothetical protein